MYQTKCPEDLFAFRRDPAGAMPDCNALQATVKCEGMESPGK